MAKPLMTMLLASTYIQLHGPQHSLHAQTLKTRLQNHSILLKHRTDTSTDKLLIDQRWRLVEIISPHSNKQSLGEFSYPMSSADNPLRVAHPLDLMPR